MRKFSFFDKLKFLKGRVLSSIKNQLLAISFEVTLSCICHCRHCDLGGIRENEKQIKPEDFGKIVKDLKPIVVQLSGGEPLLRKDIIKIAKAVKQFGNLPYTILVTNGALLTKEKYLKLREAGVDQFSISLDFPDKRHDDFRRYPGLFEHLNELIPSISKYNFKDIILNSCITKANFKEVISLAKKAIDWGAEISYSAYTPLRTGNEELSFNSEEDLKSLRQVFKKLIEFKRKTNCIINSETTLLKFLKFLERGYMPNCKAGFKFIVVMPDGSFIPCSMKRKRFSNLKELREKFSKGNICGNCYVSIRCYSEKSFMEEIKELPYYLRLIQK
jgi:MoaA/NifB/PqqE/SkfB family radical SAM enzyme